MTTLEKTAYHEAGHAVTALHLGMKFKYVTIVPDLEKGSVGHIRHQRGLTEHAVDNISRDKLEKHLKCTLAGNAVEKKLTGRYDNVGASGDHEFAADLVFRVFGSPEIANAYLKYISLATTALVNTDHIWEIIEKVAQQLLERKTLTQDEVFEVRKQHWESRFGKIS